MCVYSNFLRQDVRIVREHKTHQQPYGFVVLKQWTGNAYVRPHLMRPQLKLDCACRWEDCFVQRPKISDQYNDFDITVCVNEQVEKIFLKQPQSFRHSMPCCRLLKYCQYVYSTSFVRGDYIEFQPLFDCQVSTLTALEGILPHSLKLKIGQSTLLQPAEEPEQR